MIDTKFDFRTDTPTGKDPDKHMVISRGLGVHSIKVRLFNPGELTVCNLNRIG